MAYEQSVITPKPPAVPAAPAPDVTAAQPAAPPEGPSESALPDDLLRIPAIGAILVGQPAAFSATLKEFEKRPEAKLIMQNKGPLMSAGMGLYRSLSGDTGVLFNRRFIADADIKSADEAGRLQEIAPPFDALNQQLGSGPHPMMNAEAGPDGFAVAQPPATPTAAIVPPPPASVPRQAQAARVKALTPGLPISGTRPGSGTLMRQILKPAV